MTFTHLPFEMDNYHMWPKSPSRFLSKGLAGDPPLQSESPKRLISGILVLRWESKADFSCGGQDVQGLSQLDFFSLQSGSVLAGSLALPASTCVLDSSRREDKWVCGLTLFCGKNDPMSGRWSLSTSYYRHRYTLMLHINLPVRRAKWAFYY